MLSREMIKWVVLAAAAAIPLAFFAMQEWLKRFVYRINIGWEIFILAAASALLIALLAVSFQSYKAAAADPVRSLRHE
jgi:putative ABC transport system permease protein